LSGGDEKVREELGKELKEAWKRIPQKYPGCGAGNGSIIWSVYLAAEVHPINVVENSISDPAVFGKSCLTTTL
jgi:hypothetical protein